eukprot:4957821-Pyramimonas_sp.AAC.1
MEPIELLRCQGVFGGSFAELAPDFSPAELSSLAGNAFNANSAMAFQISAMASFGPPGTAEEASPA